SALATALCTALSGFEKRLAPFTQALPWAMLRWPFGPKSNGHNGQQVSIETKNPGTYACGLTILFVVQISDHGHQPPYDTPLQSHEAPGAGPVIVLLSIPEFDKTPPGSPDRSGAWDSQKAGCH